VTSDMAKAMHLPSAHEAGALVASVDANTPAAQAGLQPGDVIQTVGEKPVGNPRDLATEIAAAQPGSDISLGIVRDGETKTMKATLGTQPGEQVADRGREQAGENSQYKIGVALAPLTPELREKLQVPEQTHGAVVAGVKPGSPAAQAGLQQGDILLGIGGKKIGNPREAAESIGAATKSRQPVALQVMRDGHTQFVAVNPKAADTGDGNDQG
jgi:serine protease Do